LTVGLDNGKDKGKSTSPHIQNARSPAKLGLVPTATSSILTIPGLDLVENRISSDIKHASTAVDNPQRHPLL
jgi:hypothetical protein